MTNPVICEHGSYYAGECYRCEIARLRDELEKKDEAIYLHKLMERQLREELANAEKESAKLEDRERAALDLLAAAQCPKCGGTGYVCKVSARDGEPYPDPCEWCRIYTALASKEVE